MFDQILIVIEVVIGLAFIYYILSLIVQAGTEFVLDRIDLSARDLQVGLRELLYDDEKFKEFMAHPRVQNLMTKKFKLLPSAENLPDNKGLSYIPPKAFSAVFLGLFMPDIAEKDTIKDVLRALDKSELDEKYKSLLTTKLKAGKKDVENVRVLVEEWFDEKMDVLTELYTRQAKLIAFLVGLILAFFFGVDTIELGTYLWETPTARAFIIEKANASLEAQEGTEADTTSSETLQQAYAEFKDLGAFEIPLTWDFESGQNIANFYKDMSSGEFWLKIGGILLTSLAISQGSSYWHDIIISLQGRKQEDDEE